MIIPIGLARLDPKKLPITAKVWPREGCKSLGRNFINEVKIPPRSSVPLKQIRKLITKYQRS